MHSLTTTAIACLLMLLPGVSFQPFLLGPVSYSNPTLLTASPPDLASIHSTLRETSAGDDLVLATDFKNSDKIYDWAVTFITEVRDADGVTVLLTFNSGIVNSSSSIQVGASWVPRYAGDYELRSFAISNLEEPMILSPISSSTVTIAASSGAIPVQVNDNEYEIAYKFNDTGRVVGLGVDPETANIELSVRNVLEDGAIEVRIPLKLIEEFERTSDGKLDGEFAVFIDNRPVEAAEWEKTDTELVMYVSLDAASAHTIEIIGSFEL